MMRFDSTLEFARACDTNDPLRAFRQRFYIPLHNNRESVYFTGNSLGLQPKSTLKYITLELEDWAALGVMGHENAHHPWVSYHEMFEGPVSRLAGSLPGEVVVMNQLTVNLHLLMMSFYRPDARRYRILCEAKAFPSDQYALVSQVQLRGFDPKDAIVEVAPRAGEQTIRTEDIMARITEAGDSLALVLIGGVNYYTGQVFDMEAITRAAHDVGAYAGFDLAHAIGNVSLKLHDWGVDFACWCSYKYLNSGPGSVAGAFIHERHASNATLPRCAGWWGTNKKERFKMASHFDPIPTAEGWQLSNAPVFSMAAHKASLDIFEEAGFDRLLQKSRQLTQYLFFLLDEINRDAKHKVVQLITPRDAHGCQISLLMLERGKEIFAALIDQGVIADWREPNVIRIAPVPLYNTFEDVWQFSHIIRTILNT